VLDLASLASVRAFATFIATNFPGQTLDLLINNAGVMAVPKRELTVDGYERPPRYRTSDPRQLD
jgi:NAD(P)-dependent dehydrogenase (short-subunit alcohol dehydrogenase family)